MGKSKEPMGDLLLHLAKITPFDMIVEILEEDIEKYKLDPENKELIGKLEFTAMMLTVKKVVDLSDGNVDALKAEMQKMRAGNQFLTPKDN